MITIYVIILISCCFEKFILNHNIKKKVKYSEKFLRILYSLKYHWTIHCIHKFCMFSRRQSLLQHGRRKSSLFASLSYILCIASVIMNIMLIFEFFPNVSETIPVPLSSNRKILYWDTRSIFQLHTDEAENNGTNHIRKSNSCSIWLFSKWWRKAAKTNIWHWK